MGFRSAALRLTLRVIDASLGNHQPVNIDAEEPVCASCRPLQAWPCEHFHHLTERRAVIEADLEEGKSL